MLRAPKAVDSILAKKINHPFETAPQTPQTTSNVYSERYMLRDNDKPSQESLMPFGNQTWQLTSPVHGGFNGKRINKWEIFQPAAIDCRMVYPIVIPLISQYLWFMGWLWLWILMNVNGYMILIIIFHTYSITIPLIIIYPLMEYTQNNGSLISHRHST